MGRKFTVYGLRFSKTSFWNRMNTGFLDPAVATVPTACGIETYHKKLNSYTQRYFVATVPTACGIETLVPKFRCYFVFGVATVPTACGIETLLVQPNACHSAMMLQQYLPLAVLKPQKLALTIP